MATDHVAAGKKRVRNDDVDVNDLVNNDDDGDNDGDDDDVAAAHGPASSAAADGSVGLAAVKPAAAVAAANDDDDEEEEEEVEEGNDAEIDMLETIMFKRQKVKLPKRGEKGFAPTGALDEESKLEKARLLTYEAMKDERRPPIKGLSIANWDPETNMAKLVTVHGNVFASMGRIHRQTHYLLPEETAYLVERGVMQLFVNGQAATVQQTLHVCLRSFPVEKYVVFCYFKRLGYIITRHGLPWSDIPTPDEALTAVRAPLSDSDIGQFEASLAAPPNETTEVASTQPAPIPSAASTSVIGNAFVFVQQTIQSVSGWVRNIFVRQQPQSSASSSKPLVNYDERPTPEELMKKLCFIPEAPRPKPTAQGDRLIDFDVYKPNNQFGRRHPPPIAFKVFVARYADPPPDMHALNALMGAAAGTPLRGAVVHGGTINFYALINQQLPHHTLNMITKPKQPQQQQQQHKKHNNGKPRYNNKRQKLHDNSATVDTDAMSL